MSGDREEGILLSGICLWSKWGFNDGDLPDEVWDWGPVTGWDAAPPRDWTGALGVLVHRHLVPALGPGLADSVHLYENFGTSHNPYRVESIDGMEVGDDWDTRSSPPAPLEGRFARVAVLATRAQVVAAVEETGGWRT